MSLYQKGYFILMSNYEFIKRKMDNADSFATAMSSGKYGSLD